MLQLIDNISRDAEYLTRASCLQLLNNIYLAFTGRISVPLLVDQFQYLVIHWLNLNFGFNHEILPVKFCFLIILIIHPMFYNCVC
jgi:hypothetical protein